MVRAAFQPSNRDRMKSGIAVAAVHGLLGYALIAGLDVRTRGELIDSLSLVDLTEPVPPAMTENVPEPDKTPEPEGAASPPNLHATPTQVVVPPPEIRLPVVQPIPAAPIASTGSAPSAGAADIRGPGTGQWRAGDRPRQRRFGHRYRLAGAARSPARWLRGSIDDEDYPRREFEAGIGGTVHFRFVVGVNGRVTECRLTRSSGSVALDTTTCTLVHEALPLPPGEERARQADTQRHSRRASTGAYIRRPDLVLEEPADDEVRR